MAARLAELKKSGPGVLMAYLRNVRLKLFSQSRRVIQEANALINECLFIAGGATFFGCFFSCRCCLPSPSYSASTPSSRSGSARSMSSSAKSSASWMNRAFTCYSPSSACEALIVNFSGECYTLDLRLDQSYLRSQAVNSEEGRPMGIGVWYEMYISDPVAYLFKNADPRGSLAANVGNATVRCLSNMKLAEMLENRHAMSSTVRTEVSPLSQDWGYKLGSVYIRKVHFRDVGMTQQIEAKVVNRLRQVTSAIKQDGTNQVNIITSTAERQAAIEFAKADAMRPQIVGLALQKISQDPEISRTMFEILETQNIIDGKAEITLVPRNQQLLASIMATQAMASAA